jgi:hypothetical protein
MTEAEKQRDEILKFLLAWDAEQVAIDARPEKNLDDADPVVRALSYFPKVSLQ